jgi:hypothetical protein
VNAIPIAHLIFCLTIPTIALAQVPGPSSTPPLQQQTSPDAQSGASQTQTDPYVDGLGTDCAYSNFFVGPAATVGNEAARGTATGGVTFGQYFARTLGKGVVGSPQFELGVVGPLPNGHVLDGFVSMNGMFANKIRNHGIYPSVTGGYTRMIVTGNAVNFGVGVDLETDANKRIIRIELRDYYLFTGPRQHVVGLRIGFGKFIGD